jgi:hypothetical protein
MQNLQEYYFLSIENNIILKGKRALNLKIKSLVFKVVNVKPLKKKSKKMTDWYRVAAVAVNESVGVLKIINSLSANKLKRQAINDNVCGAHELSWDPLRQTWRYVCMWFPPSLRNLRILRTKFQPTYQLNSTKFHARYL